LEALVLELLSALRLGLALEALELEVALEALALERLSALRSALAWELRSALELELLSALLSALALVLRSQICTTPGTRHGFAP
jgi:hypothetical protein